MHADSRSSVSTLNPCVARRTNASVHRLRCRYAQHERDLLAVCFVPFALSVTAAGGEVEGYIQRTAQLVHEMHPHRSRKNRRCNSSTSARPITCAPSVNDTIP